MSSASTSIDRSSAPVVPPATVTPTPSTTPARSKIACAASSRTTPPCGFSRSTCPLTSVSSASPTTVNGCSTPCARIKIWCPGCAASSRAAEALRMIEVAPRSLRFSGAPSTPGMPPMASTSAGSSPSRNDSASCCPLSRLRIETVSNSARRNPTIRSSSPNAASKSSATRCGTTASAWETLRPGVVSYCTRWSTRPEISIAWVRRLLLSVSPVVNADEMISVLSISPKTISSVCARRRGMLRRPSRKNSGCRSAR